MKTEYLNLFLANIWDKFKHNSPITATAIYVLTTSILTLSAIAPDYGLGLPKWFNIVVVIATAAYNGINGSRTQQILGK